MNHAIIGEGPCLLREPSGPVLDAQTRNLAELLHIVRDQSHVETGRVGGGPAAEQPRAFAIDTTALGAGQFVLRLTVRDQDERTAETAVLFEVVEQATGAAR